MIWLFYVTGFIKEKACGLKINLFLRFFPTTHVFRGLQVFEIFFADVNSIENSMKNCYHFSIKPVLYIFCLLHLLICGSSAFRCQLTNKQEITKKNKKSWEGLWYVVLMICGGLRLFINKKFWELIKLWSQ